MIGSIYVCDFGVRLVSSYIYTSIFFLSISLLVRILQFNYCLGYRAKDEDGSHVLLMLRTRIPMSDLIRLCES